MHDEIELARRLAREDDQRGDPGRLPDHQELGRADHLDVGDVRIGDRDLAGRISDLQHVRPVHPKVQPTEGLGCGGVRNDRRSGQAQQRVAGEPSEMRSHQRSPLGACCSLQTSPRPRTKTCSLTFVPRMTSTGYFSIWGSGSGALRATTTLAVGCGAVDAASESREDGVAPGVLTTSVSRRLRWTSMSLPSACATARRSVCCGVSAMVTVVLVTGLLSFISTVWPAASTVTSCRITLAIFSFAPGDLGMLTSTSTRLFGSTKPLSRVASSSLMVTPR